jgi:hypothetical protein
MKLQLGFRITAEGRGSVRLRSHPDSLSRFLPNAKVKLMVMLLPRPLGRSIGRSSGRVVRWYAECRQELLHVIVGLFAQHPLLRRLRISAPDCLREVVQVGASLPNEFKACPPVET